MAQPFPATHADWEIAGRTLLGEARGEPFEGQIAVAWVIRNRAEKPSWWGGTVSEVCLKPSQFSCWLDGDPNKSVIEAVTPQLATFRRALGIAALVLSGDLPDPVDGATHYFTSIRPNIDTSWPPVWARSLKQTARIGAHVFLREWRTSERTSA